MATDLDFWRDRGTRRGAEDVSVDAWSALGNMLLAVGAIVAGLWAAFVHMRSRRIDAARWILEGFTAFYRDDKLLEARDIFEYEYWRLVRPVIEMRVTDRHVHLDRRQQEVVTAVDLILNFMENLLYLEQETHIRGRDREVFFSYWFGILHYPGRAGLRRYLENCGYERCAREVGAEKSEFIVLQSEVAARFALGKPVVVSLPLAESAETGFALDMTSTPHRLSAYRFDVDAHLRELDHLHGYRANDAASTVSRVCVPTMDVRFDVWVYLPSDQASRLQDMLPEAGGTYRAIDVR